MKLSRITLEQALFALALLLAISVRFSYLGASALLDPEAEQALQSSMISRGEDVELAPGPAYGFLTGAIFLLFGEANFNARFWPAIAGTGLILLAFLLRSKLGRLGAIVLAFGLALDPGLVAVSRFASGLMLAVGFGILALGFAFSRKPVLAGVFGGLALLSGPQAIHGIAQLALAGGIGILFYRNGTLSLLWERETEKIKAPLLSPGVFAGGGTILFAGTLLFLYPEGLGSFAGTIPAYLEGWIIPSGVPIGRLFATLVVYQTLPLVFGIAATIHAWRRQASTMQWVSIWAITSLVLVLLYPGRQVADLAWALVPLWILAAWEISSHLRTDDVEWLPAAGQGILLTVLLVLGWINLTGLSSLGGDPRAYRLRWIVIAGMLTLGGVTALLVGMGWTFKTARRGLAWGLLLTLGSFLFSSMWGTARLSRNGEQELWNPSPVIRQHREFMLSLGDLSEWNTGIRNALDLVVTSPDPSLRWELRGWPNARFMTSVPQGELPSVIISTEDQPAPDLASSYRGQDFAWWVAWDWSGALPPDWVRWVVFRDSPVQIRHVILWARGDLFPEGTLIPEDEGSSVEDDSILE